METSYLLKLAIALVILVALGAGGRVAQADAWPYFFISTGDNQFGSEITPLDSPETIGAVFESMASFGARTVYWRGEQDRSWLEDGYFRPELPLYYDYWQWMRHLNYKVKTNELAVAAARRNGMRIYCYDGLFEYAAPGDAPGCGFLPYQTEMRVRMEHPEWVVCDRWGERLAPGPLEYAYPGARKHLIDKVMRHVRDYDGVGFYTYAENYGYRYPEEFGFNEPVVKEFERRYGVDIRTQGFDKQAWYKLRGEYVTQLFRELHAALARKGKKLSIVIWGDQPDVPMGWQTYTKWTTIGPIRMDYETWVREGIVDEIVVFHNNEGFVNRLLEIKGAKPLSIVVLGPATDAQKSAGVAQMTDVWSNVCAGRMSPASVTAADITSTDWARRAQALIDAAGGAVKLETAQVADAVADTRALVRRQAIRTLVAVGASDQVAVIEKALDDPENCVRVAAASALAKMNGSESAAKLVDAVRRHGEFQLKNAAVLSLKAMLGGSEAVVVAGLSDDSQAVREVATRALVDATSKESEAALVQALQKDADYRVRHWALKALARRPGVALAACRTGLGDKVPTVQLEAARGLGNLAPTLSSSNATRSLASLLALFREYGDGCKRSDAAWGWRVVGNATAAFGENGKAQLEKLRVQRDDKWLAWAAYQVLHVPQADDGATLTTEADALANHAKFAPPFPGWRTDLSE